MCAIAFVDFIDPSDPHERQRTERRRLLEQRVAETLALKPSKPCPILKGCEHGTYKLSPDEEEREIRDYLRRSRQVRIMQVRAQEMLLAAQRVGDFRQRKKNEKHKLLRVLKEAWQEEHNRRIADVEEGLVTSCKGIGQSHNAAQEVIKNMAAMAEEKVKQAEENRLWETLRYQKAKQEECARKSETVEMDKLAAAKDRRRVLECAAEIERTRARYRASQAKFKSMEGKRSGPEEDPQKYLHPHFNSYDIKRNFIQSRLAGTPNDYKDTYFHSRFCVLKDKTNLNNSEDPDEYEEQNDAERDAWEAAETHLKKVELEQQQKAEVEEFWNNRKVERGQQAAAHLQKIASLEEELAMEVEQEQERKHQLRLIEELSKAAHASTYKPAQRRHLDPRPYVNTVVEEKSAPTNEEPSDSNAADCSGTLHADAAEPVKSETTQPPQQIEKGTGTLENSIKQVSMPARDAGISSRQSTPDINRRSGNSDGKDDEFFDAQDTEIVDVRIDVPEPSRIPLTPVKILTGCSEMKIDPPSTPRNMNGAQLSRKTMANEGRTMVNQESTGPSNNVDPNPPGRTQKVQSARVPTKAQKCVVSTPQVSSLPNVSASNNIRKGNKSPQRLNSLDKAASNDLENQGTVDQVTEVGSRPRGRQAVPSTKAQEKKSALPTIARKMEVCTAAEGKKMTPRRHNGTWLANVLEKLTWWKSQKGRPISGVFAPQDPAASENLPISGGQPAKPSNREGRKECTSKFPVKQVDSPAKLRTLNRRLPTRSKNFENANSLARSELQTDNEPGWYEAYTKDVFSAEELDALQLELYGTWTDAGAPAQNKAKPTRDKVKLGQQDNDYDILNQQGHTRQPKGESKGKVAGNSNIDRNTKDPAEQLDVGKFNIEHVIGGKSSNEFLEKAPVEEVSCEPPAVPDVDPEHTREFVREDVQPISSPSLPEGFHELDYQSKVENQGSKSERVKKKPECDESGEPISARDVAEKLIQAWQTGQLGGASSPITDHSKQTGLQGSRKRRAQTDEPLKDCSVRGIGRRKSITKAQQISATKVGKWEIPIVWPENSVPQEKRVANASGVIQSQEKSRNMRASPKTPTFTVEHSPSQIETEASQNNRVKDTAPEARCLDFILGSLSAQVKELDERLRNVTSCAIYSSFPDECCQDGEQELQSNFQEVLTAPSAGKTCQITHHGNLGAKSSGCENQDCKTTDSSAIEQEKLSPRVASTKSPTMGGKMVFKGDFSINNLRSKTGPTYLGGEGQKSIQEELSPMASMASCLENISDLMKEMSRSTGCDNIAPQTPQRSSVESIPKHPETVPRNGINELELIDDDDKYSVGAKGSEQDLFVPSRVSLKSSAELCSGVLQRQIDGNLNCPLPFERASLSTINLEEAMSLDEIEEQLLLSGSVDFSPWNTEKLPDVFSSIVNVAKSVNYSVEEDDNTHRDGEADVDCEGTLRPVYCHVKKESEWLLRGNKFRGKGKAYEKRRAGKAKGKQKKSPKKTFNPVALPPRHLTPRKHSSPRRPSTATVLPKVSTTRIQPTVPLPRALQFQKKEFKLASDGSSKLNLTTRSLPAQFPGSVTAEEVQKWLRREAAVSCSAASPVGTPSREGVASVTRHQFAGYKRPEISEPIAGQQLKLMAQSPVRIPDWGLRDSNYRKKTVQPFVESRRRPASAGTVLKR